MFGRSTANWLIIEHADGRLEDRGFVDMEVRLAVINLGERQDDLDMRPLLRAWCDQSGWKGGVRLDPGDKTDGTEPLPVVMKGGERRLWHIGRGAYALAKARGFLTPIGEDLQAAAG
jgi:hypothetical protein